MTDPTYRCKREMIEVITEGKSYQIKLHATAEESTPHWYIVGDNNQFQTLEQAVMNIRNLPMTTTPQSPKCGTTQSEANNQLTK